ncbi:MAG: SMC-Scp complex subunit ScpB [Candidatus Aenigmatarchaeota archaeon]|nr:SMC-Scp complex subunit ScpB [Candidatus Aenigmarchaeota archaeon]
MSKVSETEKIAILEAALFITEKPLSIEKLSEILNIEKEKVIELLEKLKRRYISEDFGIHLSEIGGYRLVVKPKYLSYVRKLTRHADLSRSLLRVLSIVAHYKEVRQADLVRVLGNRVYDYVKKLEEIGFIKTEKTSRTKIIKLTKRFEEYFGVVE